ncbi:MAG: hypothetical protein ABIN96_02915, partial [Rubrivivax sp.]
MHEAVTRAERSDFVLTQYISHNVGELDPEKLSPLLRLRYPALNDAFAELGKPEQVRRCSSDSSAISTVGRPSTLPGRAPGAPG